MRITPENITELQSDEIFVFGSNLGGYHNVGAARQAMVWGAQMYNPRGIQGQTYAIPTKDRTIKTLSVKAIDGYVDSFINFSKRFPEKKFLVTKIGCGLANLQVSDIAPLFRYALDLENVYLPIEFIEFLNTKN